MNEQVVKSDYIFRGHIVNLRLDQVRLSNDKQTMTVREIVEHRGAAAIVAVDEQDRVLLVRQYRSAAGHELLEVPAGTLEPGEDPAVCATRELQEETGYRAARWEPLGFFYPSPGFSTEKIHLFLAQGLSQAEAAPEEDEMIEVKSVPLGQALDQIERGEIVDAKTLIGLVRARQWLVRTRGKG